MMHMADQTTGPDQTGARAYRPAGHRTALSPDQTSQTGPAHQTTRTAPTPAIRQTSRTTADQTGRADQTTEVPR
jgi:hypothetical protein